MLSVVLLVIAIVVLFFNYVVQIIKPNNEYILKQENCYPNHVFRFKEKVMICEKCNYIEKY